MSDAERRRETLVASAARSGGRRLRRDAFASVRVRIRGAFRGETLELACAFAELAFFLIRRIAQEMKSARLYFSVFSKIEAFGIDTDRSIEGRFPLD